MKEHPLLFTSEMVRAILDDRKTQTRRVPVERYRNWKVGDTIWVREGFRFDCCGGAYPCTKEWISLQFKADDKYQKYYFQKQAPGLKGGGKSGFRWQPSIHMPRWAARIFLEITGLRVERAQEINEKDTKAEGVIIRNIGETYWRAFRTLWDSINAKRHGGIYAWDKNPEVKVIEFKRKG